MPFRVVPLLFLLERPSSIHYNVCHWSWVFHKSPYVRTKWIYKGNPIQNGIFFLNMTSLAYIL